MPIRAGAHFAPGVAVFILGLMFPLVLAPARDALAQPKPVPPKFDKAQTQEIHALVQLVNDVTAGKPAPADFAVSWQYHSLKARDQRTFVPYCLAIPQGTLTSPSVAVYVRVTARAGETPPAAAADKKNPKAQPSVFPFEDVYFAELKAPAGKDPYRLTRALSVAPGDYDVYLAVRERQTGDQKATPRATLLKLPMSVPDYWKPELMTSTIILAEQVEPLTAPIPETQVLENPYALGSMRFVPAPENRKYTKKDELAVVFLIYNTIDKDKKPDVTVEYSFNQKVDSGEKYFNKTNPQVFNATTLPPQFDAATGHQLVAGQTVPLASFPEGDYRLEIKVTDKNAGKTIVQNVLFSVTQ